DDHDRDEHFDQADTPHPADPGWRPRPATRREEAGGRHQHAPPPLARVLTTVPLIMMVMTLWFSAGLSVGTQTVSCCCASISPEARNTMPAAGPATCTEAGLALSRMVSVTPVTLSTPVMIQRLQSALQLTPSVVPQIRTRALRRSASERASCSEAVSSPD